MTQIERMIYWFRMKGGKATLGQILTSGEPWCSEFRARMSDAKRKEIAHFVCHKNYRQPSMNLYQIVDKSGQVEMGI